METNNHERLYLNDNRDLSDKIQQYLKKKPEGWVSALRKIGLKPKSPTENAQMLLQAVALYGSNLEKVIEHVGTKLEESKEKYQTLKETTDKEIENLRKEYNTLKTKVDAGALLEGKNAETYKIFKEQIDKAQKLGKDIENGFQAYNAFKERIDKAQKLGKNIENGFQKFCENIIGKKL
jgi:chromosome segregation ATPase